MPRDGGAGLLVAAMVLIVCAINLLVTRVRVRGGARRGKHVRVPPRGSSVFPLSLCLEALLTRVSGTKNK